jgi:hypothetical protein
VILAACKATELGEDPEHAQLVPSELIGWATVEIMTWSVSAEGYSERTSKMLRAINSQKAWEMVCSGQVLGDDEDDYGEAEAVELIRKRVLEALRRKGAGDGSR